MNPKIEILQKMFTESYVHTPGGLFKATDQFTCKVENVGAINPSPKGLSIQGEVPVSVEHALISIVRVTSPLFAQFNSTNTLIGAVKIVASGISSTSDVGINSVDESKLTYTKAGTVRVESGMLQIATANFQDVCEQAQIAFNEQNDPSADFYDKFEKSEIPGFTFEKLNSSEVSTTIRITANGGAGIAMSVDIQSGYGDGEYPVTVGVNEKGETCVVYIDFMLFDRNDIIERII